MVTRKVLPWKFITFPCSGPLFTVSQPSGHVVALCSLWVNPVGNNKNDVSILVLHVVCSLIPILSFPGFSIVQFSGLLLWRFLDCFRHSFQGWFFPTCLVWAEKSCLWNNYYGLIPWTVIYVSWLIFHFRYVGNTPGFSQYPNTRCLHFNVGKYVCVLQFYIQGNVDKVIFRWKIVWLKFLRMVSQWTEEVGGSVRKWRGGLCFKRLSTHSFDLNCMTVQTKHFHLSTQAVWKSEKNLVSFLMRTWCNWKMMKSAKLTGCVSCIFINYMLNTSCVRRSPPAS